MILYFFYWNKLIYFFQITAICILNLSIWKWLESICGSHGENVILHIYVLILVWETWLNILAYQWMVVFKNQRFREPWESISSKEKLLNAELSYSSYYRMEVSFGMNLGPNVSVLTTGKDYSLANLVYPLKNLQIQSICKKIYKTLCIVFFNSNYLVKLLFIWKSTVVSNQWKYTSQNEDLECFEAWKKTSRCVGTTP